MESASSALTRFIRELRTRRVSRVAVTYVAVAFAGLQGLELVLSPLGAERAYRWIVIATLAGFPVALALAWFFDLRRAGAPRVFHAAEPAAGDERRRWSRHRIAAIAVIVLAGVGLLGYRMLAARPAISPAAEVIAVAPFSAVGGEASALGEGMAQLLTVNLDQVGGLRTLDPTRVLRAWSEGGSGRRSDEEALALGRKLGAGSVLISSAVAVGGEVRLSSVLRAVNGWEIARAEVTGRAGDVLLLADSLSNRLLREIWRSRSPVPQLRIAAITTTNLDAIRAYLDGERYYRQLRWDSAIAALRRAVELDSSFALAHRRLADAYSWKGEGALRLIAGENAAAARTPERLPERERGVALAAALWHDKKDYRGALDSLTSHLRRYPDDAEALYLRAEILFHGGPAAGVTKRDSLLSAFEDALRLDPELTPAMIHPMGMALRLGDSVRFRRYLTHVLRAKLPDSARVVTALVDSAIGLYWQRDTGVARVTRRIVTDPALRDLAWESPPIITLLFAGRDPNPAADAMRAVDPEALDTLTLMMTASPLIALGRISEAERFLRALARRSPGDAERYRLTAVAFGVAGRSFLPRSWQSGPPGMDPAVAALAVAILDLSVGDTAAAARELATAQSASGRLPPAMEELRRFQAGRLQVLRGDFPGGVKEMERSLRAMKSMPPAPGEPPRYLHSVFLAEAHAEYAPTRKQGIEELRRHEVGMPLIPLVRIYRARALEAEGQREAAKQEYVIFLRQTGRAEGPLAQLHREAQAALARLTRER